MRCLRAYRSRWGVQGRPERGPPSPISAVVRLPQGTQPRLWTGEWTSARQHALPLNARDGVLSVDAARVDAVVSGLTARGEGEDPYLSGSQLWPAYAWPEPGRPGAVIVLLPGGISAEANYPADPIGGSVPFTAVSTERHWDQVVMRAIARGLGLGDEFERSGPETQRAPARGRTR